MRTHGAVTVTIGRYRGVLTSETAVAFFKGTSGLKLDLPVGDDAFAFFRPVLLSPGRQCRQSLTVRHTASLEVNSQAEA